MSEITGNEMPINNIKPYIKANVKLQCSKQTTTRLFMAGAPGCGKSDVMKQMCQENGWGLKCVYLSNLSLEQLTGIPCKIEEGSEAVWSKPEIFNFNELEYRPENYDENESVTILFLDDIHLADRIFQKYLFQILTYKNLNGYRLPEKCAIILAGNRNTDKALANTIPAPVINRVSIYEVCSDSHDWLKNFAFTHGIRDDILSFISAKGDKFLSQEPIENTPWASPRSWTFLSEQMDAYEELNGKIKINDLKIMATGLIGAEYASEFISYREIFAKWNIEDLYKKSEKDLIKMFTHEVEENPIAAYAIINSANTWMFSKLREKKFDISDKNVINAINFTYKIMTCMLQVRCKGVFLKPLVIAGSEFICTFQEVMSEHLSKLNVDYDVKSILNVFLLNLKQERDIDWIYFEILANIFGVELSEDDIDSINEAKERLDI
jgi:hypothetical protein